MIVTNARNYQYLISTLGVLDPTSDQSLTDVLNTTQALGSASSAAATYFQDAQTSSTANFSQAASLMSNLSKLETQAPETFKTVTAGIAENLRDLAGASSDTATAYTLKNLAAQFSNASLAGSLSGMSGSDSSTKGLKGYSSPKNPLLAAFMTQAQDPDVFNAINTVIGLNIAKAGRQAGISS